MKGFSIMTKIISKSYCSKVATTDKVYYLCSLNQFNLERSRHGKILCSHNAHDEVCLCRNENKFTLPKSLQVVHLQRLNDVYLSYHHYDKTSAIRMFFVISIKMHNTLITDITAKIRPFLIIIDSATDKKISIIS